MQTHSPSIRLIALANVIALVAGFAACGTSKPSGSDYVGLWEGARTEFCACLLDITKNGESFLIKNQSDCRSCDAYEGIFTLTPEGNLRGGPMGSLSLSFDRESKRTAFSPGSGLQYLTKLSSQARETRLFLKAMLSQGFSFDGTSRPTCQINGTQGQCKVEAFISAELSQDPFAYSCAKLDKATYSGQCTDGFLDGLCVLNADGSAKQSREAFVAFFSGGRILYPALTTYLDNENLNFGVQERHSSYGCVYYGRWNNVDSREGCVKFKTLFGPDIFSESNARSLKNGTFDLSQYSRTFARSISGQAAQ